MSAVNDNDSRQRALSADHEDDDTEGHVFAEIFFNNYVPHTPLHLVYGEGRPPRTSEAMFSPFARSFENLVSRHLTPMQRYSPSG